MSEISELDTNCETEMNSHVSEVENVNNSDNDSDENEVVNKIQKKRIACIDSDSESEQEIKTNTETMDKAEDENENEEINNGSKRLKSRLYQLCDSESENEEIINENGELNNEDVELNNQDVELNKVQEELNYEDVEMNKENVVHDDSDIRLKNLCDSESSEDETLKFSTENNDENTIIFKSNITKQRQKVLTKKTDSKPKMTGREAQAQMREIKSVSQRMVRESRFSLPYHRPKSYTLQDFLKRKSRIEDVIRAPPNTPATQAIKMSVTHLTCLTQRLEEREKQLKMLYQSDSESETELNNQQNETVKNSVENEVQLNETENEIKDTSKENDLIKQNENSNENILEKETNGNECNNKIVEDENEEKENTRSETFEENIIEDKLPSENKNEFTTNDKIDELESENKNENTSVDEKNENETDKLIENESESNKVINEEMEELKENNSEKQQQEENVNNNILINNKLKKLNLLTSVDLNFKPRLNSVSDDLIVLDEESVEKSKRVNDLMKRFLEHAVIKKEHKKHTEIRGENEDEDEPRKKNPTPGAKMKKLKEELEERIAQNRFEEWNKRNQEKLIENELEGEQRSECGVEDDPILDDDQEEENLTDETDSEEEEDEEEEDEEMNEMKERRVKKSAFLDEEALETDADDEEDEDEEVYEEPKELEPPIKKPLRRIITTFEDDSDEEVDEQLQTQENISETNERNLNSWEDNDEEIPLNQRAGLEKTPCRPQIENNENFQFLTPTIELSALQSMSSITTIEPNQSSDLNSLLPSDEPSPLKNFKARLFNDSMEEINNINDDLEELCSGKFTHLSTQETELLNVCSGTFASTGQVTQNENEELSKEKNEEESKKFVFAFSSDDDEEDETGTCSKRKKNRRNCISDEDEEDQRNDILRDFDSPDESSGESEEEEEPTRVVNYDSEENEVEEFEENEDEEVVRKAQDFFEAEAELSGSEFGSADEDERELDDFDLEEGDEEKFNERKLQRELERIHVRQVLDEDKREVRLLQELLLEDGELHGTGRERKFRWKNADSLTWNDTNAPKVDEEECEDMESELEWRKSRHERELFLKEMKSGKDELLSCTSEIMKLGQAALEKTDSQLSQQTEPEAPVSEIKLPFILPNKRGSFLSRSETVLTRLAELTQTTSGLLSNGPRNSKKFVFTSVERTETILVENEKKRKGEEETGKILKKIRITDLSPAVQKYKRKSLKT